MSERAPLPHIRALDGVRGAAIVAVLFFHADMLRGGFLGVDLFFVLSGFLITSLLLSESSRTAHVNVLAFWARRARRLLPALFLVLIGVGLYAAFVAAPGELNRIRGDALATLAYVANWRYVVSGFDYFALFSAPSPLNHTWSLAIEEQFYLVWPLVFTAVLAIGARRARASGRDRDWIARTIFIVCAVLAVGSAALMIALWYRTGNENRVYYGTDTRAASILIGAMVASLFAWRGPVRSQRGRIALEAAAVGALVVLAVAWVKLDGPRLYEGGLLVCAIAGGVVIAAASNNTKGPVARLLSIRPLTALGLISYGVYLWHWPVYVWLSPERVDLSRWPLLGLRLVVTFAIAIASYYWVEMPIRRGAFSASTLRWLTPAAAALLIAVTLVTTRGYVSPALAADDARQSTAAATRLAGAKPGSRRLMVVGNSVGFFLAAEGFGHFPTEPPVVPLNAALAGCNFPFTAKVRYGSPTAQPGIDCREPWSEGIKTFNPDVVLLLLGDAGNISYLHDGHWIQPCDKGYAAFHRKALEGALTELTSRGAHLVLTTGAYSRIPQNVDVALREETDCANAVVKKFGAAHPEVGLIDMGRFVCPTFDTCLSELNGATARPDGVHFRGRSAVGMAKWLLPQLGLHVAPTAPVSSTRPAS